MSKKHQVLHGIYHFLVGFVFILKGTDKISHHPFIGGLILLFGIITWTYFFYHVWRRKEGKTLSLLVHLFEGVALLFIAYIFYTEGAKYLPYVSLVSAIGFFIGAIVMINRQRRSQSSIMQVQSEVQEKSEDKTSESPGLENKNSKSQQ